MAIASTTDLANMALSRIGQQVEITSLSQGTAAAKACNRFYDMVRRNVLEAWRWRFATKRAVLTELSAVERDGWEYVYNVPTDLVAAQYIWAGVDDEQCPADQRVPFTLEFESTAAHAERIALFTDVAPVASVDPLLIYTFDQTDVTRWPQHFVDAVAWRLGAEVCMPLTGKADKARAAFDLAAIQLTAAITAEQTGRRARPQPDSEFITTRG